VVRLFLPCPATVLVRGRGRLSWAYVPRGPVNVTPPLIEPLVAWARNRGFARLRIEPEAGAEVRRQLAQLGFRRARSVQPTHTLLVPLRDEPAMLASLHPGTRYNIRLAWRRGVHVEEGTDAAEMARQVACSASRQGVRLPGEAYFRTLLECLPWCRTYVARHRGQALAAMLVARHDGRAYYLFSGTSRARPDLKPVDASMWSAMRSAHQDGCVDFDLWGMPPGDDPAHPWYGFGQFKRGFGGRFTEYAGTWDLVLSEPDHRLIVLQDRLRYLAGRVWRPQSRGR
jgi:lipid II:glycine glycyltransferase (peptidoglycan interpeptide bridge formation enzyme)